jgi:regulator of sigma E protease
VLPVSILLVVLGFTLLIVIHELGHYLAAKWAGIRVEAFAVGMGPVAISWRRGIGLSAGSSDRKVRARFGRSAIEMSDAELARHGLGETEWSLRWLPLGGFVKMVGQDDLHPSVDARPHRSYMRASIGRRMIVVSAGVVANAVLAVALFMVAFLVGVRFEAPVIGHVIPGAPAAVATVDPPGDGRREAASVGLRPGDRVLSIDGSTVCTFSDIDIAAAMGSSTTPRRLLLQRPGVAEPLEASVLPEFDPLQGRMVFGVFPARSTTLSPQRELAAPVAAGLRDSGLGAQGVEAGMTLEALDGQVVETWQAASMLAAASEGQALTSRWRRASDSAAAEPVIATLRPLPRLENLAVPPTSHGGRSEWASGLLGLVPLVRIDAVDASSPNVGVIEPGDVVLRAGAVDAVGEGALHAPRMAQLQELVRASAGRELELELQRGERTRTQRVQVDRAGRLGVVLGLALDLPYTAVPVEQVLRQQKLVEPVEPVATPVAAASVLGGSRLVAIDGQPVTDWVMLWRAVRGAAKEVLATSAPVELELEITPPLPGASPETVALTIDPESAATLAALTWRLPIQEDLFEPMSTLLTAEGNPLTAVAMGFRQTHKMIVTTYLTLYGLMNRTVAVDQLRGPVGIVHLGTAVIQRGWPYLLFFLAMISANLAVLNFLPLPIVDGGLFLNLVYEKLRGVPPPLGFQNAATLVGLFLIAGIFLMTFYFDVMRLVG